MCDTEEGFKVKAKLCEVVRYWFKSHIRNCMEKKKKYLLKKFTSN